MITWCNHDPTVNICLECRQKNSAEQRVNEAEQRHANLIERLEEYLEEFRAWSNSPGIGVYQFAARLQQIIDEAKK